MYSIIYGLTIGLEEFDDNFNDSNDIIDIKEEMANNDLPWYISLLQSLVKLKEETEDEQKCEAIYNYNSLKFNDTALHDDLAGKVIDAIAQNHS